tara:strand:- start:16 stop:435 length:420 start_codon:yes stop_codon:yes gene_type:complete
MGKVKTGSKLLAALGRTKKEQMKALMPPGVKKARTSTSVKSKAPYIRGKVMGKGDSDKFLARRAVMGGVKASLPKPSIAASASVPLGLAAAGVAGYQMGKKKGVKNVRAQEAKKAAEEGIKKQKTKKKERAMRGRRPKK